MKLTEEQEALVKSYVSDVEIQLDASLPQSIRAQFLDRLRVRIEQELKALPKEALEVADVQAVLGRFGSPSAQAAKAAPPPVTGSTAGFALDPGSAVWLGVCAGLARWLGFDARAVRAAAVALGISGPFVLLAYMCAYGYLYATSKDPAVPRINYLRVAQHVILTLIGIFVFYYGAHYTLAGIEHAHERFLHRGIPPLGEWAWLRYRMEPMFSWTLFTAVPFAILSGLPLARGWDYSLKRLTQAIIALYGIALAFGISLYLVGLILEHVSEFVQ